MVHQQKKKKETKHIELGFDRVKTQIVECGKVPDGGAGRPLAARHSPAQLDPAPPRVIKAPGTGRPVNPSRSQRSLHLHCTLSRTGDTGGGFKLKKHPDTLSHFPN